MLYWKRFEDSLNQFYFYKLKKNKVETSSGKYIPMEVDSLCIHGDNPLAEEILKAIHQLEQSISIKSFQL